MCRTADGENCFSPTVKFLTLFEEYGQNEVGYQTQLQASLLYFQGLFFCVN